MTIADDWGVKQQTKSTKKTLNYRLNKKVLKKYQDVRSSFLSKICKEDQQKQLDVSIFAANILPI